MGVDSGVCHCAYPLLQILPVWIFWKLNQTLHCKKSWRKTPPAWPDVTDSLVRGTENFFNMKIELIRRVPTTKTEYFEIIGISRRFFVLPQRSFPTIFRQLSDEWIIKSSTCGTRSHILQVYNPLLYHCATLSLCEFVWQHYFFTFSEHVYLRQYCVNLRQYCVNLRQYCVFLRQCSVHLCQYSVFLPPVLC